MKIHHILSKKANARLELLRRVAAFTTSIEDKKNIYVLYIRSILEQSSVVWHNSLTQENSDDLERVQKSVIRIILGQSFDDYEEALENVELDSLKQRREVLSTNFAKKSAKNKKTEKMFPVREKIHDMDKRNEEHFQVDFANTNRLKNSAIPSMQRMLNIDHKLTGIRRRRMPG